jgi:hypothetical protein
MPNGRSLVFGCNHHACQPKGVELLLCLFQGARGANKITKKAKSNRLIAFDTARIFYSGSSSVLD